MHIVRQLDKQVWRDFVDQHPNGGIFHTPEMFEIFSRTEGYQPDLWAVVDDAQRPLAIFMPVAVTLMRGPLSWVTTRSIAHGSVLCAPGLCEQESLATLLRAYHQGVKKSVLFTELRNLSDMSRWHSVISASGFVYEEHLNFLINLDQPPDQLLQSIGSRTRKKIRRGLRVGDVNVTQVTDRAGLDRWYDVLQKTYRHARVPLADRSLFEAVYEYLLPRNMAQFLLADVNGQPAACSLELPYKDTIYGWYGGSDRRFSKHYPNELLNWHIMEWGATHGYSAYDFGGAGKPDEKYGVRDFKAKFGGELVQLGRYVYIHAPHRLKLSKLFYDLFRTILPTAVS